MTRSSAALIHLCGLGTNPPHETSLETLQALNACRVVFSDVADRATLSWLKGWCRSLRRPSGAAEIVSLARREAGPVGLAVWGHPLLTSALTRQTLKRATAAKVPVRSFAAVSPLSSALARQEDFFGDDFGLGGLNAYAADSLLRGKFRPAPAIPLVVFAEPGARPRWDQVRRRLPPGDARRVKCGGAELLLAAPRSHGAR